MRRYEAIQQIMQVITDEIIVCNLGHPSQELFVVKDRPRNFYMLGSMGLVSSVGLGIAMSTKHKVVVIDGDGSVLMNLGTLATIGINQCKNYILVIIDNEAYGSTGFQPTCTSKGINLEQVARACNISSTSLVTKEEAIRETMQKVLKSNDGPHCMVIKTEQGMPDNISIIPYDAITIRDRFVSSIQV